MIRHDVVVDTASLPHADDGHLYLHSGLTTRLHLGDPRHADPVAHGQTARWLRRLADEAADLAGRHEALARHARGTCPPLCDRCHACACRFDAARLVGRGAENLCPACATATTPTGRTRTQ